MNISLRVHLCLSCLIISGCSSTVELTSAVNAHRRIGAGSVVVQLKSGQEFAGRDLNVRADSTLFIDRKTEDTLRFSTRDIRSVQVTHHGGGAVEGLFLGGLGGGALGFVLSSGLNSSGDEGMGKGLAILTGLLGGGAGGLVLGAVYGHDYTFVFPGDSL